MYEMNNVCFFRMHVGLLCVNAYIVSMLFQLCYQNIVKFENSQG